MCQYLECELLKWENNWLEFFNGEFFLLKCQDA